MQVNASQTYSSIGILSVSQIVFILVDVSFASVVFFYICKPVSEAENNRKGLTVYSELFISYFALGTQTEALCSI